MAAVATRLSVRTQAIWSCVADKAPRIWGRITVTLVIVFEDSTATPVGMM